MIILAWNIRGLNSPLKQQEVATILTKKKVDVGALIESKLSGTKLDQLSKRRFKRWNIVSNATSSSKARIVVIWNPNTVMIEVLDISEQGINIRINSLIHQTSFCICFVYGYNSIVLRKMLWANLRQWKPVEPWLVIGDFNSVLSLNDRNESALVTAYETSDFYSCCRDLGLSDLMYSGCHFTWNRGLSWSKIDRVLANPLWSMPSLPTSVHFCPPGGFSDHSQMWVEVLGDLPMGRRCFKFFNMWTKHDKFLQVVAEHWSISLTGCPMYVLCKKLKYLKPHLKSLNQLHFSHISERVARVVSDLSRVQQQRHVNLECRHLLEQENQLRRELINLKSSEKMFFSQKLKYKFLEDSDKGSKFFHSLMNQRNRINFIAAIQNENGQLSSSLEEVGDIFVNYFHNLLGAAKETDQPEDLVVSRGSKLNVDQFGALLAPVTSTEINDVVFNIGNDKAPGPDGYSSLFFKAAWNIVGNDVCDSIKDFFASGRLLKQVNHSVIALIPKSAHASYPSDFRPISCCNVIYKIISKILSARLAQALVTLIGPSQNAFLGGRYMSDNIHLLQELLRLYGRKRVSPRCMIKVDFKKAFDSVQWIFIRRLMLLFGFPDRFVHWVMTCVESTSYSLSINGYLFGHFEGKSGIRQGDPLSPYLFIMCMEYFSRLLLVACDKATFKLHPQCDTHKICHLAFADDIMLLCRGDIKSIRSMLGELDKFGRVSGLRMNALKSSIYLGGVSNSAKQAILRETNLSEGVFPVRYLGVPLSPHRLLASQFSPLIQGLESAIQAWLGKYLTYAGRLQLLKSVLYGIANFWLSIFPIPSTVIAGIVKTCRNFLWTGDFRKNNFAPVAWKDICMPKTEGGLNIFDLKVVNYCYLAKHLWDIHLKADSLWIKWISHYYLGSNSVWSAIAPKTASPMWKAVLKTRDRLLEKFNSMEQVVLHMGKWGKAKFFHSAYCDLKPLGIKVNWARVVWESWALPKHSFVLWLAVKGRLKTKDRLIFALDDPDCNLCRCEIESHEHLFFECNWTSTLWGWVRNWLQIGNSLSTLPCAIRYLAVRRNHLKARMRRVALSLLIYLIWEERNSRTFDGIATSVDQVFRKFQLAFFMILFFHSKAHQMAPWDPL